MGRPRSAAEESWLQIDGISGTSAGAMNAAVLVMAIGRWRRGRARRARSFLAQRLARRFAQPVPAHAPRRADGTLDARHSPAFIAMDLLSRMFSPYDLNPAGSNPLQEILHETIDFDQLARAPIKLFITATNVRTGQARVFRNAESIARRPARVRLSADAVPGRRDRWRELLGRRLFRQPDDHAARPRMHVEDTLLVQINPVERHETPRIRARHHQSPQRSLVQRRRC